VTQYDSVCVGGFRFKARAALADGHKHAIFWILLHPQSRVEDVCMASQGLVQVIKYHSCML